jgi:Dynamin family
MDPQLWSTERERIHGAIVRAAGIAQQRGEPITSSRLSRLAERLERDEFNLVVVGAFKRGKSTVVNALLGAPVLPTGVLPLTSVVTRLRWGTASTAEIRSTDGTAMRIPVEELDGFVTEAANPENRLGVASAEVQLPADLLRSGGVIVDTPGVGSTLAHNTDTTLAFLGDVDAVVFVTSPDPPISEDERRFLVAVSDHAHHLFFVLNKVDLLAGEDVDQVLAFTRSVIGEAIGGEPRVHAVSARRALGGDDPGFDAFTEALMAFLEHDLPATGVASVTRKASDAVGRIRTSIGVELDALRLSVEEIARRRSRLDAVQRDVESTQKELHALVAASGRELLAWIEGELATWRSSETERLLVEAEHVMAAGSIRPVELARTMDGLLRADLETWRPGLETAVRTRASAAREPIVARADAAAADAAASAAQILHLEPPRTPPVEGLTERSRFTYASFEVPTVMESLLPDAAAVLPTAWAAGVALRRARRRIPMIVDRYSGRVRHDLATRLEESAGELLRALDRHLAETTEGLDEALARAEERADSLARTEASRSSELQALDRELRSLAAMLSGPSGLLREHTS